MKILLTSFCLAWAVIGQAQEVATPPDANGPVPPASVAINHSGNADDISSPALTGVRRPLYRLRRLDAVQVNFTFSPEYDQQATVQPDGFLSLRGVAQFPVEGMTLPELTDAIRSRYAETLNDPEVSVILRDFEHPYFIAAGEVGRPGRFELRDDLTLSEALAVAGGLTSQARHSRVVLFRPVSDGMVESHVINVKKILHDRRLDEDVRLQSGDFIYVPKNAISKIRPFMPASDLSMYANSQQF